MKGWLLRARREQKVLGSENHFVINELKGIWSRTSWARTQIRAGEIKQKAACWWAGEVLLVRAKFLRKLFVSGKGPYIWKHRASGLLCSELRSPRSSVASGRNHSPRIVLGVVEKPWKVYYMSEISHVIYILQIEGMLNLQPPQLFFCSWYSKISLQMP